MPRAWADLTLSDFGSVGEITFQTGDNNAGDDPAIGDVIEQAAPGGTQTGVIVRIALSSGSWDDGDAAGTLYYQRTNNDAQDFSAGGSNITIDGKAATLDPTAVTATGNFDSRGGYPLYLARIDYDPANVGDDKVRMLDCHLLAILDPSATEKYGFTLDASDELQIPIRITHGRRSEAREGAFFAYALWDESAAKLRVFIGFQGLAGEGDGARSSIPKCIISVDSPNAEAGELQALDLADIAGFTFSFDTDDDSGGGGEQTPTSTTGGGGIWDPPPA